MPFEYELIKDSDVENKVVATGTDVYDSDLTMNFTGTMLVDIQVETATIITYRLTRKSAAINGTLNNNSVLTAGAKNGFEVIVISGDTLNIRHSDGGNVTVTVALLQRRG